MEKTNFKRKLSVVLSFVLIAVIALIMVGCNSNKNAGADTTASSQTTGADTTASEPTSAAPTPTVLGEGEVQLSLSITHKDGTVANFTVNTSKETATVGKALQNVGLIAGDESEYGLYVKTVDGETLDYDTDGMYWAFYENGAYAMTGVDQTKIVAGTTYELRAEK